MGIIHTHYDSSRLNYRDTKNSFPYKRDEESVMLSDVLMP